MAAKKEKQTVKQLAVKGDVKNARVLAREIVRANKQVGRLAVSKARLGSINTQLQQQLGASAYSLELGVEADGRRCSDGKSDRHPAEVD